MNDSANIPSAGLPAHAQPGSRMGQIANGNDGRFAAMIVTSTVMMYGLIYLNTYPLGHVYFSQTRAWMAVYMGAVMAVVMLGMYGKKRTNIAIFARSAVVVAAALWLVRSQATVGDVSWMEARYLSTPSPS